MAFERLAGDGAFACVMDFSMQEFGNMLAGSLVSSGKDRLTNAGASGTPQMVASGALDLLDFAGWQVIPKAYADRPFHEHNRLIKSSVFNEDERRAWIREMADRLSRAEGETHVFLPLGGVEEWDRAGQEAHDPEGQAAMIDEARKVMPGRVAMTEVNAHINDPEFSDAVLRLFDQWPADGTIKKTPIASSQPSNVGTKR